MKLIGITGGMGAGKSEAARLLASLGYPVLDADQVARRLSQPGGAAHAELIQHFGTSQPQELARLAFSEGRREELQRILHPLIKQESDRWFADVAQKTGADFAFYEASLLFEAGRAKDFDQVFLITAPEQIRIERIMRNRGIDETQARARIATQWSDERKLQEARTKGIEVAVIQNMSDLSALDAALRQHLK